MAMPIHSYHPPADIIPDEAPVDDHDDFQELPNPRVNLTKLSAILRSKFGIGKYEIHLMHDVYSIRAPGRLSLVSSASPTSRFCTWNELS